MQTRRSSAKRTTRKRCRTRKGRRRCTSRRRATRHTPRRRYVKYKYYLSQPSAQTPPPRPPKPAGLAGMFPPTLERPTRPVPAVPGGYANVL